MAEAAAKQTNPKPDDPTSEDEAKPAKRWDLLGLVVFVLVCLNLGTAGAMGYFMQKMWERIQDLQSQTHRLTAKTNQPESQVGKEMQAPGMGELFPIESFLVNITSDQGPKFLQAQMELELADPAVAEELTRKKPAIRDSVIVLLSSRSFKDLREPNGMKKLRADLLRSMNNLLTTGKVKEIYFTQFHFN